MHPHSHTYVLTISFLFLGNEKKCKQDHRTTIYNRGLEWPKVSTLWLSHPDSLKWLEMGGNWHQLLWPRPPQSSPPPWFVHLYKGKAQVSLNNHTDTPPKIPTWLPHNPQIVQSELVWLRHASSIKCQESSKYKGFTVTIFHPPHKHVHQIQSNAHHQTICTQMHSRSRCSLSLVNGNKNILIGYYCFCWQRQHLSHRRIKQHSSLSKWPMWNVYTQVHYRNLYSTLQSSCSAVPCKWFLWG